MAYVSAEARQSLLSEIARAVDHLAAGLASIGEAYELLDDDSADRLEADVFRPLQLAYGRAKRTHTDFSDRHGLFRRVFRPANARPSASGARGHIEAAIEAIETADEEISELQDSMLPVEVGDAELRAGLAEVRRMIGDLPGRGRRFVNLIGR